jgi:hypothetical protein
MNNMNRMIKAIVERLDEMFVVYDNNGETADRYTAINKEDFSIWAFGSNPFHPQGIGQFAGELDSAPENWEDLIHLGKIVNIETLNEDCIAFLIQCM